MKNKKITTLPYEHNPAIKVFSEWEFDGHRLCLGDKFKVKGERGSFIFRQYVDNTSLNVQWIDCWDAVSGEFRSFYSDRFMPPKKEKVARVKKPRANSK